MASAKRGKFIVAIIALLLAIHIGLAFLFGLDRLVDLWWYRSLGYEFYFWQRLLYKYAVFGVVTIVFFGFFFLNLRIARRCLSSPDRSPDDGENSQSSNLRFYRWFRKGSLALSIPLALGLGIVVALPLYRHWETFLFFIFGPAAGVQDPVFSRDISYYLFSFPVYRMIQSRLLICFIVLFLGTGLLYWIESRLLARQGRKLPAAARWHLSFLLLAAFLIESWEFILQRNDLVYKSTYEPIFSGPGFVDMKIVVPLIWLQVFFWTASVICLLVVIHRNRGFKVLVALLLAFFAVLGAREADFLPEAVKKYYVAPNEFTRESPFIANNIHSTLKAYKLDGVEIRPFSPTSLPPHYDSPGVRRLLHNVPLWEARTLAPVLEQLQGFRPYYSFPTVTVDRYEIPDDYVQVFVAPRELDYRHLPGKTDSWVNRHLTYTHGYGAAMTPANQPGESPMIWFMHGIPVHSVDGLKLEKPGIYYGLQQAPYAIAPNSTGEMDYPRGKDNVTADYQGQGGIPISSMLRRLVFAWYLGDRNIFFTTRMEEKSRVLLRRNIVERIRKLTPFLLLDKAPYMVANSRGIFWIQDAYTTSSRYPVSAATQRGDARFNYIRNSVKIVVDAYNGTLDYYLYDADDPIALAYDRIYPGLLKDKDEMPSDIRKHIRYPRDIFDVQMKIYAKYHQTDPKVFYQEEDVWIYAAQGSRDSGPVEPHYLTLELFGSKRPDFVLMVPMMPKNRNNLRAMAVAGCDGADYGKLVVYEFPKGKLVLSPNQVFAVINEEPEIAKQFTLWDQAGSEILRGRVIILPIGNSIFYIQPVYLRSAYRPRIPELQRIILSEGQTAVMDASMDEAYRKLWRRVHSARQQVQERYPSTAN